MDRDENAFLTAIWTGVLGKEWYHVVSGVPGKNRAGSTAKDVTTVTSPARHKRQAASRQKQSAQSLYPNAPLVESVFEIRFPSEPAVESRRDAFFALVRKEFPVVRAPNVEPGQAVALQPYHFTSADQAHTVMTALNRFAYATSRYQGFEVFSSRALQLSERFCQIYRIQQLSRTGLRYINAIPFAREEGVIPWKHYFTVGLSLPATSPEEFTNINLAYESRTPAGSITTRIACGKSSDGSQEIFILDFDFAKSGTLKTAELRTYMQESHEHTKKVFESILTDEYKAVMRGEVVK